MVQRHVCSHPSRPQWNEFHHSTIWIINPDPDCEMGIVRIKQTFHPIFDVSRYIIEQGMAHPTFCSILGEGELL